MPPHSQDNPSGSSSVFPEAILPSVAVISSLVLITFVGAVIIFARAYRQRKRQQLSQKEKDRRARMGAGGGIPRESDEENNVKTPKTGRRLFGRLFSRNRETAAPRYPPPAARTTRESKTLSHNVREISDDELHRERGSNDERAKGAVTAGRGYGNWHARRTPGLGVSGSVTVPAVPVVGKLERMTGSALSNELYTHRASGSASTRGGKTPAHRQSAQEWPRLTRIAVPRTPPLGPLKLDTNSSPASHATDETSAFQDFSPNYENILGLSAPPPVASTLIDRKYPHVAALARANIPSAKPSSRLSYTYSCSNLTEHIATQYNPTSRPRRASERSSMNIKSLPDPPLSAAFGGFKEGPSASKGKGKRASRDSAGSATPKHLSIPTHRRSWSGRSVLELDAPEDSPREATPPSPLPPPPPSPPRRTNSNPQHTPPKFATTPLLRTSAVGSHPLLPPILLLPPSTSEISGSNYLDVALSRACSTSKRSVASIPSTVSSFNAVSAPVNPIHGLSPTPPRLASPPAAVSDQRWGGTIGALAADMSEISNFTEGELEMEMARIRDRARRASDERRWKRREEERRRVGGPSSSN